LTEATNMIGATVSNEVEVAAKLDRIASQVDGILLAEFGYSDGDPLEHVLPNGEDKQSMSSCFTEAGVLTACSSGRCALEGSCIG